MRLIRLLKKDLAMEASTWVDSRLISADQARAICRLYGIDYDTIRSGSTAHRVLAALGILFITRFAPIRPDRRPGSAGAMRGLSRPRSPRRRDPGARRLAPGFAPDLTTPTAWGDDAAATDRRNGECMG